MLDHNNQFKDIHNFNAMLILPDLIKALQVTQGDINLIGEDTKKLMQMTPNAGFTITAPYAFECQCCKHALPENRYYQIIKETIGAGMTRKTNESDIRTTKNILTIEELGFKPEFSSTLNYVEGVGYACDHCMDSVFSDNE